MLIMKFNRDSNTLRYASFFDGVYFDECLESDFAKRVVKGVDKSDLIGPRLLDSPILGSISPLSMSGGAK
jgi:hypothetical protein